MIPYGKQSVSQADIEAVLRVLRSDFLTQGPVVPEFENCIKDYCQVDHAVALNSATAALHVACLALGLGPGDVLWTSSITFVASSNCALYCGAKVDFVDINPQTYNMSVEALEIKLKSAKEHRQLPKVVVPVHLCGQSCDMETIYKLSLEYGFKIIEDASHAIGGRFQDKPVGNCDYSDIAVFSFHPVKIITSGEGGMAVTNDQMLADRMRLLRTHGITTDRKSFSKRSESEIWNYQQTGLGFNYRMSDIHAALGLSQMERLEHFLEKRQNLAGVYDKRLSDLPIITPFQHPKSKSSYHLYPVLVDEKKCGINQKFFYEELRRNGVGANLHYIPVYRQPFYEAMGFQEGYCPNAEKYFNESVTLPLFPTMSDEDLEHVIYSIQRILGQEK